MNRQQIDLPNHLSKQYIIHNLNKPITARLKSRKSCGPYYGERRTSGDTAIGFYMECNPNGYLAIGDSSINLRVEYCDKIDDVRINHGGWYRDEDGSGDTIRGIVARLPRSRGFLAGWTLGAGMLSELHTEIHTCERDAAYAADSIAETVAERERYYSEAHGLEADNDYLRDEVAELRETYTIIRMEIKLICKDYANIAKKVPNVGGHVYATLQRIRQDVGKKIQTIRENKERIADIHSYHLQ